MGILSQKQTKLSLNFESQINFSITFSFCQLFLQDLRIFTINLFSDSYFYTQMNVVKEI